MLDRERRGPDPHLDRKIALFGVAAVLALFGMIGHRDWLILLAFIPLALAFLLRFFNRNE